MLAQGESVEAHALRERGWTISAIARHLGRNRETIRDYLDGKRVPGVRAPSGPDAFGEYAAYCGQRFGDDPHLFATTLFDEVRGLGYGGGYSSFTRALRTRGLRPRCEQCARAGTPQEYAVIDRSPAG
jgi:transposase